MPILLRLLTAAAVLMASSLAFAAPGDLDTGFGGGKGWVNTGLLSNVGEACAYSVLQQMDGKLVAAGYNEMPGEKDFAVTRYNSDGSLDSSFDGDGRVSTDIQDGGSDIIRKVIQQADGKLVAVGTTANKNNSADVKLALVRYNNNGALDTSFGSAGVVVMSMGMTHSYGMSLLQQTDGKLVVAGYGDNAGSDNFVLARYNSDGSLDTAFGSGGKVATSIGTGSANGLSLMQQADGKLVVAGYSDETGSNNDFAVVRYNSNGLLDTAFGTGGIVVTPVGSGDDEAYAIIQQADGKLVAVGNSSSNFSLVRYNSNGSLDSAFGSGGKQILTNHSAGAAESVVQEQSGKLVVVGSSYLSGQRDISLARVGTTGLLDVTFDGDGWLDTSILAGSQSADYGHALLQQPDGKLVVAGYSGFASTLEGNFALVRYLNNGVLDTTFDNDGKRVTAFPYSKSIPGAMAVQSDGKILVTGASEFKWGGDFSAIYRVFLLRYNQDGQLDTSLDGDGWLVKTFLGNDDQGMAVLEQADGKLVVAALTTGDSGQECIGLLRYNHDGTPDSSFDGDGQLIKSAGCSYDHPYSVIQQYDGKLVVGAKINFGFALLRYNANGSLDSTFDGDGVLQPGTSASDGNIAVIQQFDGKLVMAGSSLNATVDFSVFRYNPDGTPDSGFDGDGKVTTAVGSSTDEVASVIQQKDGKLVVVGKSLAGQQENVAVVRYNSDGSLDSGFDGDGMAVTVVNSTSLTITSVVQQIDGKLVVAGDMNSGSARFFLLLRYQSDGALDTTFGVGGKMTIPMGRSVLGRSLLVRQPDGKLLLASSASGMPTGRELVVLRLLSGVEDIDTDGVPDNEDAFPFDPTEWLDTDSDGTGNNADWDDDDDGVPDAVDSEPLNPAVATEINLPLNGKYDGSLLREATRIE